MRKQKILITGAAGFIGYSLCKKLITNKKLRSYWYRQFELLLFCKIKKSENKRVKSMKKIFNF